LTETQKSLQLFLRMIWKQPSGKASVAFCGLAILGFVIDCPGPAMAIAICSLAAYYFAAYRVISNKAAEIARLEWIRDRLANGLMSHKQAASLIDDRPADVNSESTVDH
jgi:hypothetical protein